MKISKFRYSVREDRGIIQMLIRLTRSFQALFGHINWIGYLFVSPTAFLLCVFAAMELRSQSYPIM